MADADGHLLGSAGRGQEASIGGHFLVGRTGEVTVELQDLLRLPKGMEHQTRQHWANRIEPELEGSHHAKVAPTTTDGPEEVWVLDVTCDPHLAVGSDEIDREQVVADQAVSVPSQPRPPPSVRPAMPVSATVPPVVAKPKAWVSRSNSPHLTPPSARTVRRTGSTRMPFMRDRLITSPPLHTPVSRPLAIQP